MMDWYRKAQEDDLLGDVMKEMYEPPAPPAPPPKVKRPALVICPYDDCHENVAELGAKPRMWGTKRVLMCGGCGKWVTEDGEAVPEGTPLTKPKTKARTFDMAKINEWAEEVAAGSQFSMQFGE